MKITTKLAWEYFKKNRKRNTGIIVGIAVVTVLITTVLILMASYQEYMVNSVRKEGDWEAKFSNITYGEAMEIAKDENIKEISISHKIGVTEENFSKSNMWKLNFDVRAYDKNALKNANINFIEGRMPENSNEIVISIVLEDKDNFKEQISLGDKLKFTINGEEKEYLVVGITTHLEIDNRGFGFSELGAITNLDKKDIREDSKIDATILTKNIQKIYSTTKKYNLPNLTYNEVILNYAGVLEANTQFTKNLALISGALILLIMFVSIVMLYTLFKMTYSQKIRELGMLSSIGMDKKQRKDMNLKEVIMLGIIRNNYRVGNRHCHISSIIKHNKSIIRWIFARYSRNT